MNNKNKIGCVIAYSEDHNNYGTYLQDFATIKKLQNLGFKCEIIRYNKHLSIFKKIKLIFLMFRCHGYIDKIREVKERINIIRNKQYKEYIKLRTKSVCAYKEKYLKPLFRNFEGYEALCKGSCGYKAVIVGSDQMWTPLSLYSNFYNLMFVCESVRKISYATSFGVSEIPKFQEKATKNYLDRFYKISVREISGKKIVDQLSRNKAKVVADPTMLLSPNEWEKEIEDSEVNETEPYIFCYFLGTNQDARKAVNELKAKTGLKIITIRHMDEYVSEDENFGDEAPYSVDPNDFVKYISKATYVCTDSFHCSVFSILFKRKFLTFYRYKSSSKSSRNTRIDNLLQKFGLTERLYDGNIETITKNINYDEVHSILDEYREESLCFLANALKFDK